MEKSQPAWLYDEFINSGVNYQDPAVVEAYESRHKRFRDFAAEAQRLRDRIGLTGQETLVDLGCGTGALTMEIAPFCRRIDAVDVSEGMLGVLKKRAEEKNAHHIHCHHAGFLTYRHQGEKANVVFSSIALHHLPDFWKVFALKRIHSILKPRGIFYLTDVVVIADVQTMEDATERLVADMSAGAGPEAYLHIRREFSSFDWILELIFKKTGFAVEKIFDENSFLRTYICRKIDSI